MTVAASTALLLACGSSATAADREVKRRDASTGYITDLSPVQVAAVAAVSGQTTVFVRGTDGAIWYRTEDSGGWTGWAAIPRQGMTSGPSVVHSGSGVYVYARGPDGSLMETMSDFDLSTGRPTRWVTSGASTSSLPWNSLGGRLTSAPGAASPGVASRTVVVRGTDGALWQRTFDGFSGGWDNWISLGGVAHSAAAPVDQYQPGPGCLVNVVGTDGRLWQTSTTFLTGSSRDQTTWTGGRVASTHGVGIGLRQGQTLLTLAAPDHSVTLRNLTTAAVVPLGGRVTSTAAITTLPTRGGLSDEVRVFARGTDDALWYVDYNLRTGIASPWTSLGGRLA